MLVTPHHFRGALAVFLLLLGLVPVSSAWAQSACDAQTAARLEFLETRLEQGRTRAAWWYYGWLSFFAVGAGVQGTRAAVTHGHDADLLAGSIKATLGVIDLAFDPLAGRKGASEARAIPEDSPENCARRLAVDESTMERAARQGHTRSSWLRHLSSLALNLTAATLVDEVWDDERRAWESFAISEAVSEVHLWSHPWRAIDDWETYRTTFGGAPVASLGWQWQLAAAPGGLAVRCAF